MPTEQELARLSAAIEGTAHEIREAVLPLGAVEYVAVLRVMGDDDVELKVVTRGDAAMAYADEPFVQRALQRAPDAETVVVIAADHSVSPVPVITARITLTTGDDEAGEVEG